MGILDPPSWFQTSALRDNGGSYYDVRQSGAKCNGTSGYTGQAISGSPTFTDPAASFTSALIGQVFTMRTTGGIWTGTVNAVPTSTTLTISTNAPANSQAGGTHGAITSGQSHFADTTTTFPQSLMGAIVTVQGAGAGGAALTGQILTPDVAGTGCYLVATGNQNSAVNAGTTVSGASYTVNLGMYTIGTDDGAAWASAITAASTAAAAGLSPVIRWNGVSMVSSFPVVPGGVTIQGGGSDPDQPAIAWAVNGSVIRANGNFTGGQSALVRLGASADYQDTHLGAQLIDCTVDAAQVAAYAVKTAGNMGQMHRVLARNGTTGAVLLAGWQTQMHACCFEQPGYGVVLDVQEADAQMIGGFVKSGQYQFKVSAGIFDFQATGVHCWNSWAPATSTVNNNVLVTTASRVSFTGCYFDNVYGPQVQVTVPSGQAVAELEFVGCKFFQASVPWMTFPDNTYPVFSLDTSAGGGASLDRLIVSGCSGAGLSSAGRYSAVVSYVTNTGISSVTYGDTIIGNCAALYAGSTPNISTWGNVKVYDSAASTWRITPFPGGNTNPITAAGNGSQTAFTVTHNMAGTPKRMSVMPTTTAAAAPFFITVSTTTLTITYLTAPSNGAALGWNVSLEL